jgi:hypothetical protein
MRLPLSQNCPQYCSKKAAELAQEEVRSVKQALARSSTIADFSAAVTTMNEIKRLHRVEAWTILPDRYAALRSTLISIRSMNPDLKAEVTTHLLHVCSLHVEHLLVQPGGKKDPFYIRPFEAIMTPDAQPILLATKRSWRCLALSPQHTQE